MADVRANLTLSAFPAWPDVNDVFDIGFENCTIGRIWLARDSASVETQWEWLISVPMALPEATKGQAQSLDAAFNAFAVAWVQVVVTTPTARLERALNLSRGLDLGPRGAATFVKEIVVKARAANPTVPDKTQAEAVPAQHVRNAASAPVPPPLDRPFPPSPRADAKPPGPVAPPTNVKSTAQAANLGAAPSAPPIAVAPRFGLKPQVVTARMVWQAPAPWLVRRT